MSILLTKKCDTCKLERSTDLFGRNRSKPGGLHTTCKECKRRLDKEYQDKNKAKIKVRKHGHYLRNKEEIKERVCAYIDRNRDKHNAWGTKARTKLKTEVFSHYCGGNIRCQNCAKITDLALLTIDHVNGGGNKHRKEAGIKTGYKTYLWLKRNNYPGDFQVLCWNCQFKRRLQQMAPDNPTKRQVQKSEYRKLVKSQCLAQYGGVCSCGETDQDVLTLDHVNDDGVHHRRETGTRGFNFYIFLRKNGFPNDPALQVLCMCCQYKKRAG